MVSPLDGYLLHFFGRLGYSEQRVHGHDSEALEHLEYIEADKQLVA